MDEMSVRFGKYKPISAWGYIGYSILFALPIIGLILMLVFSFSGKNINRRNFARAYLIGIIITVIIIIINCSAAGFSLDALWQLIDNVHYM